MVSRCVANHCQLKFFFKSPLCLLQKSVMAPGTRSWRGLRFADPSADVWGRTRERQRAGMARLLDQLSGQEKVQWLMESSDSLFDLVTDLSQDLSGEEVEHRFTKGQCYSLLSDIYVLLLVMTYDMKSSPATEQAGCLRLLGRSIGRLSRIGFRILIKTLLVAMMGRLL